MLRSRTAAVEKYGPLAEEPRTPWILSNAYLRYQRVASWAFVGIGVAMIAAASVQAVGSLLR